MATFLSRGLDFIKKHVSLVLIILFVISIVPLLAVSMFNWPAGDDFRFSIQTHQAMSASGLPLLNVIKAAAGIAASSYWHWQGTYSAIFVMALQPSVFSARAYIVVAFILIGALTFGTLYLLNTILSKCFHMEKKYLIYIGIPMLFLQIQFVPSLVEAFYWYNGAMYYTFFYSLMLIYISQFINIFLYEEKKYIKNLIIAIILAVVLGGGNFVTALLTTLIGLCFLFFTLVNHTRPIKRTICLVLPQIVLIVAFVISMAAPGNSVRQQFSTKLSPVRAVYRSLIQALVDIKNWTTPTVIIICLLLIPLIFQITKRMSFQFRWPGVWVVLTFLLFASQNAPTLYAQAYIGQNRLRNIIFYSFIWIIFMDLFYFVGWVQNTYSLAISKFTNFITKQFTPKEIIASKHAIFPLFLIILVAINVSSASQKISGGICTYDLISGKAAEYNRQLSERQTILDNPNIGVVKIPALTVYPKSISASDITYNVDHWTNKSMAIFYNKKSIVKYDKSKKSKSETKPKVAPQEPNMLN